ncbi:phosphoribosyltransferase family protein [Flavobacterium sp. SUN046]|uniref:ComF family protein n=1 Tax=Flavobacterium sp. SUN046 TaxID=3002440 RepID=UPI002DBD07EA|nr:phosphoribosyltransferase family protein [Flavobacterium sp. SUN046]MEC4048002.1 phosphoribosyltransferase family protein [Flavobacterium sp. SUN046]
MYKSLINLFFPKVCAGCEALLLEDENVICAHCRHEVPLTHQHLTADNEFYGKFYGKIPLEYASALLYFHKKGIVQELIHQLKYKGHQEIGTAIGQWYGAELKTVKTIQTVDHIIPVPLHAKKLRQRGYNQVSTFGKALSEALEIPLEENILDRILYSKTQTSKSIENRTALSENIFQATFDERHLNKHFLLIDDVITTGSTLEACAHALLKIPGSKISMVCMAMSQS